MTGEGASSAGVAGAERVFIRNLHLRIVPRADRSIGDRPMIELAPNLHAATMPVRRSLVLSENRKLRIVTLFLFYFAQGLPFGLIDYALPAWLAQNGASAAAIGSVLALVILPWTFKLVYGFAMDRYVFLAMGRRRPWIMVGQSGIIAAFLAMAFSNPGVNEIGLLAAFAFALGLASAVQDVAVDGLAIDILPPGEIERVNGYMFGGQAIGIAAGAAVSGTLIAYEGLPAAALALAGVTTAILVLVMVVRERPGERLGRRHVRRPRVTGGA